MATSLLDWIADLLRDPDGREAFHAEPERYASQHGFDHLSPGDVHDSLTLLSDHGYPTPRHYDGGDHQHGADYLRGYFQENREFIDHRDTDVDNSVHQDINTGGRDHDRGHDFGHDRDDHDRDDHDRRNDHDRDDFGRHDRGGDFHQTIDNDPVVASGDRAVAVGHDIRDSTVTSGSGNVVGHDNQAVTGSGNTTAFGSGDATNASFDGARFGDGAGVSIGGNADGHSEHNSTSTSVHGGDGATSVNVAGDHASASQYADQHESDSSTQSDYDDHSRSDSHDDYNSHNRADVHDSHDADLHHHS